MIAISERAHLRSAEKRSSGIAKGSMNLLTVSYTAGALLPDTTPVLANRRPTNVDTRGPLNSLPTLRIPETLYMC